MEKYSPSQLQKTLGWIGTGIGVLMVANAVYHELTRFKTAGKVVLITGGSRGLGLVLAREFASRGAKLALCARSADKLEIARQELERSGADVMVRPADLTNQHEVKAVIDEVVRHYGKIDVLVNNAGIIQVGPVDNMEIADYEKAMQVNFWAPLYAIHAALPYFKQQGGGRIVNITSIGGKIAVPHLLPYSASKFAAVGLSEGLNAELKQHNIHVTTVVPNLMRTGSSRNIDVKGDHEKEYAMFKIAGSSPLLSMDADSAGAAIVNAMERGESETVLSLSGKFASIVKGIAPGWVGTMMTMANNFLPKPTSTMQTKKGYEAESALSQGPTANYSDRAAVKNNEL
ncbi:MAG TPA: SDR family NAD(P)-dependent oxidoreductase [Chryseosolibacter sp.]